MVNETPNMPLGFLKLFEFHLRFQVTLTLLKLLEMSGILPEILETVGILGGFHEKCGGFLIHDFTVILKNIYGIGLFIFVCVSGCNILG